MVSCCFSLSNDLPRIPPKCGSVFTVRCLGVMVRDFCNPGKLSIPLNSLEAEVRLGVVVEVEFGLLDAEVGIATLKGDRFAEDDNVTGEAGAGDEDDEFKVDQFPEPPTVDALTAACQFAILDEIRDGVREFSAATLALPLILLL